jgi:hypothetical protein
VTVRVDERLSRRNSDSFTPRRSWLVICDMEAVLVVRIIRLGSEYGELHLVVTEALWIVIVDHTDSLHESVTDRRANELKPSLREIFT